MRKPRSDRLAHRSHIGIQQRSAFNDLNHAIANALQQTGTNSNGVSTMGQTADGSYQQWQMQMLFDKLDELINVLRR